MYTQWNIKWNSTTASVAKNEVLETYKEKSNDAGKSHGTRMKSDLWKL